MADVVVLPAARADHLEIGGFIALDDPARARTFVAEIEDVILQQVAVRPNGFAAREDLSAGLRVARHRRYRIFFTTAEGIEIVRVLHAARDLSDVFKG